VNRVKEIGIISDTHGLLRPEAILALEGCELILHAGDVEGDWILAELNEIAPCLAVVGNCDDDSSLPNFRLEEISGQRVLLHHGHLSIDEASFKPTIIITGHSHQPLIENIDGALRINPGSAGPHRFSKPITIARLTINQEGAQAKIIHLPVK
jgi:hypothetical protein